MNPERVAVPPNVVTDTFPVAPKATTAVICVAEFTVKLPAGVPPKLTAETPKKFVPVIVMEALEADAVGVKLVIVGGGIVTVNPARLAVPPGVETATLPVAPVETTAPICVDETTIKLVTGTPPIVTDVVPVKFVPLIVIPAPGLPIVGVKLVTVGVGKKAKPPSVPVPPGVVTRTFPLAPPAAITALICDGERTV